MKRSRSQGFDIFQYYSIKYNALRIRGATITAAIVTNSIIPFLNDHPEIVILDFYQNEMSYSQMLCTRRNSLGGNSYVH